MPIIKTSLVSNNSVVSTGAPQSSPANSVFQNSNLQNANIPSESPILEDALEINENDLLNTHQTNTDRKKSLKDKVETIRDRNSISKTTTSSKNKVSTNQDSTVRSEVIRQIRVSNTDADNSFSVEQPNDDNYSQLTGLSSARPEIVSISQFYPLVENNSQEKTIYGKFFEIQNQLKNAKKTNLRKVIEFNSQKSTKFLNKTRLRKQKFSDDFNKLLFAVSGLTNLVQDADNLKIKLDCASFYNKVLWENSLRDYFVKFGNVDGVNFENSFPQEFYNLFPSQIDAFDVLRVLGFSVSENDRETLSSSRILMQIVYELISSIKYHSTNLGSGFLNQEEKESNKIQKFSRQRLSLNDFSIDSLQDLYGKNPENINETIEKINDIYLELYANNRSTDSISKIISVSNLISKIIKFSKHIGDQNVRVFLQDTFGYSFDEKGDSNYIDYVFGDISVFSITEKTRNIKNSLESVLRQRDSDGNIILAMEPTKFSDYENIKAFPGSIAYIDSVFKLKSRGFDTEDSYFFHRLLKGSVKSFGEAINKMDLLFLSRHKSENLVNSNDIFSDPYLLLDNILSKMVNFDNGQLRQPMFQDPVVSIFSESQKNTKLKTLLFLFFLTPNSRHNLKNDIKEKIKNEISELDIAEKSNTRIFSQNTEQEVSVDEIVNSLVTFNSADKLNQTIYELMNSLKHVLGSGFENEEPYCVNDSFQTNWKNYQDTLVMMSFFDLVVDIISRFSSQSISSKISSGKNSRRNTSDARREEVTKFTIKTNVSNKRQDLESILSGIKREISSIQISLIFLYSFFSSVEKRLDSFLKSVSSRETNSNLFELLKYFDDVSLAELLFTKEQMFLLENKLSEINLGLRFPEDTIRFFDNSLCSNKEKTFIFKLLSQKDFKSDSQKDLKIFTVGVPQNLISNFSTSKKMIRNKEDNDIIKVSLFKVDLINPEIVFQPKEFLFEMSRFVSTNDFVTKSVEGKNVSSVYDFLKYIPTRDADLIKDPLGNDVQYFDSDVSSDKISLQESRYDFLSNIQKRDILVNHIVSHLLNKYMTGTSGINLSEDVLTVLLNSNKNFDSQFIEELMEFHLNNYFDEKSFSIPENRISLFGKTIKNNSVFSQTSPKQIIEEINENRSVVRILSSLSESEILNISHQLSCVSELSYSQSDISSPDLMLKKIVIPKIFDRIFNIIVNPEDFFIDTEKTRSNDLGEQSFERLRKENFIFEETGVGNVPLFKIKRRPYDGQNIAEKYFTTISILTGE